ncbi:protein O-linked-mannose beta-1,2-N-acetylglucosaminyltransferase 1 [Cherax quadricarinatus]|uniref:protein O-linked-mannose beta-1,2-N-acetylglucosaminyltransferase 1 n=1 Tax=Cherax quadricarinatus TaxID=27406 RepID=UPI00387E7B51
MTLCAPCWLPTLLVVMLVATHPSYPHHRGNYSYEPLLSHHHHTTKKASTSSNNTETTISVLVWSGLEGWGFTLDGCLYQQHRRHNENHHQQVTCNNAPLFTLGFTLLHGDARTHSSTSTTTQQGITLSILHQRTSSLIFHKVFPLEEYWAHYMDLEWHLERVSAGRVVVMSVAVGGTVGVRYAAHHLTQLGSLLAHHLTPATHWTWTFIKGGRTFSETAVLRGTAPHHTHTILPLSHLPPPNTQTSSLEAHRWHYCDTHGAMGGLCDEFSPDPLPWPSPPPVTQQSALAGVPVVMTAGQRYQYLYYSLTALLAAPGAQHNNIMVVVGDAPPATIQLLRLLNVTFTTLPLPQQHNEHLFRYYGGVFQLLAATFPDAWAAIVIEEDVQVSPDFFSYMSQTLWLLQADPTLYCVNAYGSTKDLSHHASRIYRGENQVSWGYAITLDFVREALRAWRRPELATGSLQYDYWLYKNVAGGRECIFPDVSRTRHFGMGVNTVPWIAEMFFLLNPVVEDSEVVLEGVKEVQLPHWRKKLAASIMAATPIFQHNPCSSLLPTPPQPTTYVIYLNMTKKVDGSPDIQDYFPVAHCLGAWGFSHMGLHQGVRILQLSPTTTIYLVGVPYSPYAHLRPPHVPVWSRAALNRAEREALAERILNKNPLTIANADLTELKVMNYLSQLHQR